MADEQKPVVDAFGVERAPDTGAPVVPTPAPVADKKPDGEQSKVEDKAGDKGKKEEVDDISQHPIVKALTDKVATLEKNNGSMGKNLSGQGKIIKEAQDEIKRLKGGGKSDAEPLFKDVKRVKDLPKAQQDEMTDAEKSLFDALADTRDQMNKMVADEAAKEAEKNAAEDKKSQEQKDKEDVTTRINDVVQPAAKKLAGDDVGLANKIIENFNKFAGNEALTDEQMVERVADAARMIPGFTPAKEQKSPQGGAIKEGGETGDKFGTEAIIEQAKKARQGQSFSL